MLSFDQIKLIIKTYEKTQNISEVGNELGMTKCYVWKILNQHNIKSL